MACVCMACADECVCVCVGVCEYVCVLDVGRDASMNALVGRRRRSRRRRCPCRCLLAAEGDALHSAEWHKVLS